MTFIIFPIEKTVFFWGLHLPSLPSSPFSGRVFRPGLSGAPRLTEFKTWMAERFPSPEVRQVTQTPCLVYWIWHRHGLSFEFFSNIYKISSILMYFHGLLLWLHIFWHRLQWLHQRIMPEIRSQETWMVTWPFARSPLRLFLRLNGRYLADLALIILVTVCVFGTPLSGAMTDKSW